MQISKILNFLFKKDTQTNDSRKFNIIDFSVLDGLRGIAATYVVFNHARGNLFIGGAKYSLIKDQASWSIWEKKYFSAMQLTSLGREFVIVFFIISGFSIAYSLIKKPIISDFYLRRIIRIYPPYIFALVWAFTIYWILQKYSPGALPAEGFSVFSNWGVALKNVFYIDTGSLIEQFWSLKFEVIFYIFAPLFLLYPNFYFLISAVIAAVSLAFNINDPSGGSIAGQFILDYNIYFAAGIFCFFKYDHIKNSVIIKNKKLFYLLAIFLFLLMIGYSFFMSEGRTKISLLIATVFSILLLFNFLHHNIKTRLLMFLGNISYSVYIIHNAAIILLKGILLKTGIVDSGDIQNKFLWLLGIPFSISVSYLFYLLIEKRTREFLEKMRK